MRRLYSALFLSSMPASSSEVSVINGGQFPLPPGLSPIVYSDRGDGDVGQPGTWLARPGYTGVDMGLFERWVIRQDQNVNVPILLDVEVAGDDWWLVAAMLATARRLRPHRRWGFYATLPHLQSAIRNGDHRLMRRARDLHPGLIACCRIADFASPSLYAWPFAPVADPREDRDLVFYRLCCEAAVDLLRPHCRAVVPGVSPWCAPNASGPTGNAQADVPCGILRWSAALSVVAHVSGGEAILWGGRHHTTGTNRPWNPDADWWYPYVLRWLAGVVDQ